MTNLLKDKEEYLREKWKINWPHFRPEEVLSLDGLKLLESGYLPIQIILMDKLEALREALGGKHLVINHGVLHLRGYRSVLENSSIEDSAVNSWHCKGCAADVGVEGLDSMTIANAANRVGFIGIGLYDNFTHLDMRLGECATWDFRGKSKHA